MFLRIKGMLYLVEDNSLEKSRLSKNNHHQMDHLVVWQCHLVREVACLMNTKPLKETTNWWK